MVALRRTHPPARFAIGRRSPPDLGAETVALAFEVEDVAVVEQPIEQSSSERRISEHRTPVGERLVGGHDRRAALVTLTEELEEPDRCRLVELHVAEFIDDEQWHVVEMPLSMTGNPVDLCNPNLIEKILSGKEVDSMTGLQGSHPQPDREMRLADAGGASHILLTNRRL